MGKTGAPESCSESIASDSWKRRRASLRNPTEILPGAGLEGTLTEPRPPGSGPRNAGLRPLASLSQLLATESTTGFRPDYVDDETGTKPGTDETGDETGDRRNVSGSWEIRHVPFRAQSKKEVGAVRPELRRSKPPPQNGTAKERSGRNHRRWDYDLALASIFGSGFASGLMQIAFVASLKLLVSSPIRMTLGWRGEELARITAMSGVQDIATASLA